jgi:transcriptional regulator with XRE-family HTH domain
MKHQDYVAAREARDPAFRAARAASRPRREWQRALIRARLDAGLTQQQLAERLGTQQTAIARWESGRVCPSLDTLCHIATATGTTFLVGPGDPPVVQYPTGDQFTHFTHWIATHWGTLHQDPTPRARDMMTLINEWQRDPSRDIVDILCQLTDSAFAIRSADAVGPQTDEVPVEQ